MEKYPGSTYTKDRQKLTAGVGSFEGDNVGSDVGSDVVGFDVVGLSLGEIDGSGWPVVGLAVVGYIKK